MITGHSFAPSLDYVWNMSCHSDHHRDYTPEEVEWVFKKADFRILSHQTVDTFWSMSLHSFKGMGRGEKTEDMSKFEPYGQWYRPYDVVKQLSKAAVKLMPRLRDLIVTVAKKMVHLETCHSGSHFHLATSVAKPKERTYNVGILAQIQEQLV